MAAAAFWIALAAFLIAAGYFKVRGEALRHETLRRVIEKTGEVDQERLRELMQPPPPPVPPRQAFVSCQGDSYKVLRVFGTLALAAALGLVAFFSIVYYGGGLPPENVFIGYGVAAVVAILGVGLFISSAWCEKPPKKVSDRQDLL
jgi:hypothetical protein